MSSLTKALGWTMLLAGPAATAAPTPAVRAQVSEAACVVGHPVAVTFYATGLVSQTLRWHLTDAAFAKDSTVAVLATETPVAAGSRFQHRVTFTATQGGRLQLGPFPVVGAGPVDTLYAPAIVVQFRPERLRAALHPLRTNQPAWPVWGVVRQWAGGLLLLAAGAACGLWWWRNQGAGPAPANTAAQARQLALDKIALLEQAIPTSIHLPAQVPDQLFGILQTYLQSLPTLPGEVDSSPNYTSGQLADLAVQNTLLAELAQARFAPASIAAGRAAGLLREAQQLLLVPTHAISRSK